MRIGISASRCSDKRQEGNPGRRHFAVVPDHALTLRPYLYKEKFRD